MDHEIWITDGEKTGGIARRAPPAQGEAATSAEVVTIRTPGCRLYHVRFTDHWVLQEACIGLKTRVIQQMLLSRDLGLSAQLKGTLADFSVSQPMDLNLPHLNLPKMATFIMIFMFFFYKTGVETGGIPSKLHCVLTSRQRFV